MKSIVLKMAGFALFISQVVAAEPIGKVTETSGEVFVSHKLKKRPAAVGMEIFEKAKIKTGADGKIVIDTGDSKLTLGENAYLKIPKKSKGANADTQLDLFGGSVDFNVKKMGAEQSFRLSTPSAVAGVRGTEGTMSFDMEQGNTYTQARAHTEGRTDKSEVWTTAPGEGADDMLKDAIQADREAESQGGDFDPGEDVVSVDEGKTGIFMADGEAFVVDSDPNQDVTELGRSAVQRNDDNKAKGAHASRFAGMDAARVAYLEDLENRIQNIEAAVGNLDLPGVPALPSED